MTTAKYIQEQRDKQQRELRSRLSGQGDKTDEMIETRGVSTAAVDPRNSRARIIASAYDERVLCGEGQRLLRVLYDDNVSVVKVEQRQISLYSNCYTQQ